MTDEPEFVTQYTVWPFHLKDDEFIAIRLIEFALDSVPRERHHDMLAYIISRNPSLQPKE